MACVRMGSGGRALPPRHRHLSTLAILTFSPRRRPAGGWRWRATHWPVLPTVGLPCVSSSAPGFLKMVSTVAPATCSSGTHPWPVWYITHPSHAGGLGNIITQLRECVYLIASTTHKPILPYHCCPAIRAAKTMPINLDVKNPFWAFPTGLTHGNMATAADNDGHTPRWW